MEVCQTLRSKMDVSPAKNDKGENGGRKKKKVTYNYSFRLSYMIFRPPLWRAFKKKKTYLYSDIS